MLDFLRNAMKCKILRIVLECESRILPLLCYVFEHSISKRNELGF